MSAYVVALIEPDPDQVHWSHTEYGPTFRGLLEAYGASMIAAARPEPLEGEPLDKSITAIFRFPDAAAARSFWDDPDYRRVVHLRRERGTFQIFVLPGTDDTPWVPPAPPSR